MSVIDYVQQQEANDLAKMSWSTTWKYLVASVILMVMTFVVSGLSLVVSGLSLAVDLGLI